VTDAEGPIDAFLRSARAFVAAEPRRELDVAFWVMLNIGAAGYPTVGRLPPPPLGQEDTRTHGQVVPRLVSLPLHRGRARGPCRDYGAGAMRRREHADFLDQLRADPEGLAAFEARVAESGGPPAPYSSSMVTLIAWLREPASLLELKERKDALNSWRSLVGPAVSRDARTRWFEHRAGLPPRHRED
jgi:hypothetical protein